jgi:hypothetical protein
LASSTTAINTPLNGASRQKSQGSLHLVNTEQQQQQQPDERSTGLSQPQSRRRFHRRKQMKRSKSADLYQDPSSIASKPQNNNHNYCFPSAANPDTTKAYRHQRSASRDLIGGGDGGNGSSTSSSSSSISNIERVNRAALLRYKSLDSMTFNNRKGSSSGKSNSRRFMSKQMSMDFDSDDSVCGIPKPRK